MSYCLMNNAQMRGVFLLAGSVGRLCFHPCPAFASSLFAAAAFGVFWGGFWCFFCFIGTFAAKHKTVTPLPRELFCAKRFVPNLCRPFGFYKKARRFRAVLVRQLSMKKAWLWSRLLP